MPLGFHRPNEPVRRGSGCAAHKQCAHCTPHVPADTPPSTRDPRLDGTEDEKYHAGDDARVDECNVCNGAGADETTEEVAHSNGERGDIHAACGNLLEALAELEQKRGKSNVFRPTPSPVLLVARTGERNAVPPESTSTSRKRRETWQLSRSSTPTGPRTAYTSRSISPSQERNTRAAIAVRSSGSGHVLPAMRGSRQFHRERACDEFRDTTEDDELGLSQGERPAVNAKGTVRPSESPITLHVC
ncbi:hypothetical protein A0H81_03383 [Grifola frondosa]|uniref:Uncharacterized protein n=1 Tax=Grifola frondosa TaxID=5627 RepID=A0A1C7MK98_GRIFR|nr:hypothetical protein A0H81_03383 [Grifola frondosa]